LNAKRGCVGFEWPLTNDLIVENKETKAIDAYLLFDHQPAAEPKSKMNCTLSSIWNCLSTTLNITYCHLYDNFKLEVELEIRLCFL
jgi:hypothetical protein